MKKRVKNKNAVHLSRKIGLYERFLYAYLPQLSALSYITRLNIFDAFGTAGLDRLGTQGSPFSLFNALRKQRQHQLKKKLPLKPFSLTLISPQAPNTLSIGLELLSQANAESNTCKLDSWTDSLSDSLKKIGRISLQQPLSEKNLLLLDPLGLAAFSFQELPALVEKKTEIVLFLPLAPLWAMHHKPDKNTASEEVSVLKHQLDKLFPEEHLYWSPELNSEEFLRCLQEAFGFGGRVYTLLEPAQAELPEFALIALSKDAFILEKMLQALQSCRPADSPVSGDQLSLFGSPQAPVNPLTEQETTLILSLLEEETDNQALYLKGLQAGLLPVQLSEGLSFLISEERITVYEEKKKEIKTIPPNCLSYTAFKSPKPACFFRRTSEKDA